MKAITIHPVWAWAIVHGHKPVENRTWRTRHRGPLLIHASADSPAARRSDAAARSALEAMGVRVPPEEKIARGAIVGAVEVYDVVEMRPVGGLLPPAEEIAHHLATGPFCCLLCRPLVFRPAIPFRGQQGLFDVPGQSISREIASLAR